MIYNLRISKEMTKRNEYGREKEKWLIYLMKKKENPFGFLSHHLPHANENACVCVCVSSKDPHQITLSLLGNDNFAS